MESGTDLRPKEMGYLTPSSASAMSDDKDSKINGTGYSSEAHMNTIAQPVPHEKNAEKDTALTGSNEKANEHSSDEEDTTEYPSGTKLFCIVLALVLAIFLVSLDMTIIATAIPKITDDFGGLADVSWYGSAFFLTNGGFQSSWGKAYKFFALKPTFLLSILIFEIGSLICGVAPNSLCLIIGRAITGLGGAGIGTGAYTIIAFVTEPSKRAMYTGFVGISYGVAAVLGPLIGGAFAEKASWRWCFYINLPVGGISALIILITFHAPSGSKPVAATWREKLLHMDPVGVALIMGAIVSYILALQKGGQTEAWDNGEVIGLLVGFAVILVVFGVWEFFQGERAMIVPRLFKQRLIGVSCAYTFFFSGPYFLVIYYLPIYFQSVDNVSPTISGVYNLPLIISVTISMILSGIFVSKTGLTAPIEVLGAAFATIGAGLLYTLDVGTGTGKWIGYQIIGGVGWGAAIQLPIIVSQGSVDPMDISTATAIVICKSS
ncbi:major facilitator superfamily domain-containing protein [Clohesyomyces aquaticus]|uniref:Major facilitator superfamily domain-containing protein n=1 Tax=Clohesyomyces aquaticus TaxID=1231657 RepID=A0A1Y2A8C2_9PLEO|nr:major facilitator superfamily domain-containing protein [Clohesyomyces aquaticus]